MTEKVRILVCDDDPRVCFGIARILSKAGYHVIEAENGTDCLAKARDERPDIVLVDWVMPDIEGPEVCRRLKADPELTGIATVLVSGVKTSEEDKAEGLETGADGYLTHPLNKRAFLAHIGALVRMQRAERQLREKQRLASIGTLARGVAHEINNPMMGILGYAQLIQNRFGEMDSSLKEFADEIINETNRVTAIVKSLLGFSGNASQGSLDEDLPGIVHDARLLVSKLLQKDEIEVHVHVAPELPGVRCRRNQVQQALVALIMNARDALNEKYTGPDPDKIIALTLAVREDNGKRWGRITVEDHGTGVSDAVRERIYDPFFTTKDRTQHTGLDLGLAREIAREHGGNLTLETQPGEWTRFHLDLPVATEFHVGLPLAGGT